MMLLCIALLAILISASILTNPYALSFVKNPFTVVRNKTQFILKQNRKLYVNNSLLHIIFAYCKCAVHIVLHVYIGRRKIKDTEMEQIIARLHAIRFDPEKPYLISGDHFSVLYPRNLAIFYGSMLDKSTALSKQDWLNRQKIYIQTVAYALDVYAQAKKCTTTIVPTGKNTVTCINIYAPPSDALYGLLYGIRTIKRYAPIAPIARRLLVRYKKELKLLLNDYVNTVYDPRTGLIRKDTHLSGAKDITKRSCAFYDNVVLWATLKLAKELNIDMNVNIDQRALKQRILHTFWDNSNGIFLEDLSDESIKQRFYSSDWLIVLSTGFLDIRKKMERIYYQRSIDYIKIHNIDNPLPLKYQQVNRRNRQFALVRIVIPSYGGTAIWSHWGIEYIKALVHLYSSTGDAHYLHDAKIHLSAYRHNIIRYQGYPEVYTAKGDMLVRPFYKSILHTGWVTNFEQAVKLVEQQ